MTCPICARPFSPNGRRTFCSDACRSAAYRRRRDAVSPPVVVPRNRLRRPITVYECDSCGTRAVGDQRCEQCASFMRRVGFGGLCPCCDEPITVDELVEQAVITTP